MIIVWIQPTKWFQRILLFGINQPSGFREDYCFDSTGKGVSEKIIAWIQHGFYGLWYFMPFSIIFLLYHVVSFTDGGNRSTRRKPPTCHKSQTNFIT
jgi:hypothetical protein